MEPREIVERLRSVPAFRHLSAPQLEAVRSVLSVLAVPAGTVLAEEDSAGDTMFFIIQGDVRIEKRVDTGGAKLLALLSPGDSFGEMALIEGGPRAARAVAHTDATLFVLGKDGLDRWLRSDPPTTVGFFVELLRVATHRLRLTLEEIVLLYDLGHLTAERFEDESVFLQAVLHRMIPHLDGKWSGAAYLYNEFTHEVSRVGTEGARGDTLPETLPLAGAENRWLDDASFCLTLSGTGPAPLGFVVARNETPMTPRERQAFGLTLSAAGHVLVSALQNIKHDIEERLRARLDAQRAHGSAP